MVGLVAVILAVLAQPQPPSPAEAPERWLLAFVDVETTGLTPGYHEMIDIGIVMTDLEGAELDRFFLRIQPEHPERTSPGAVAVNAFDAERWRELDAASPSEAVAAIVAFHERVAADRPVLMVAFNSHFDAAFLDHLFRGAGKSWRDLYYYFILDVPSMAWSLGLRGLDGTSLATELGIEDEPRVAEEHTGITGAALNARIYRALLKRGAGDSLAITSLTSGTDVRLQAVSVVSDDVAWVSGLEGTFARTNDGGNTWEIGVVEGAEDLQFRDLQAFSAEVAFLMSAGPGTQSRIYKTSDGGQSWALQFANDEPEGFFDCMDFWDETHGLVYGDSVRGELVVIETEDGETWRPVPPEALPRARDGEGGFAASGTCVVTQGDSVAYIATGAGSARVLRTSDRGRSWDSFETPVAGESETSGLTSIAFGEKGEGIAVGGDISTPEAPQPNVAVTSDGGGSWKLATSPFPGPVYGVAHVPGTSPSVFVAVGPKGAAYTRDGAVTWATLSEQSFWSVGFGPSKCGYMVGPDGRVTRIDLP